MNLSHVCTGHEFLILLIFLLVSTNDFYVSAVPSMIVEVTPSSITALDVSPFNQVLLNCSLTSMDAVDLSNLLLEYSWHNGSSEEFLHGHKGVSITHQTEAVTSSTLSLTASQASLFTVYCRVKIMLKEEELFRIEQGSEVTIRGEL